MGFEIEASHHECAAGQHEIDFKYDSALATADNVTTFRMVVKTIAQKYGLHATFMPKPIYGIAGSGMHTNMSLFKDGKNAFYDPEDKLGLSKEAYSFIAGVLEHVKGITAITNPLVNSYKRLVPGYEAPCYIAWPDLDTFVIFPWRPQTGKVARFICDVYRPDGTPFEGCPRYILKKTLEEAKAMGYNLMLEMNLSFFYLKLMKMETQQLLQMIEQDILI